MHWYMPEKKEVGQDDKEHLVQKKTFIPAYKDVREQSKMFQDESKNKKVCLKSLFFKLVLKLDTNSF